MTRLLPLLALGALVVGCAGPRAVPEPAVTGLALVATFTDARALAADGSGRLYVVDAAESVVVVLDTAGVRLATFGGPGAGAYAFLEPADVDPTNGLELYVADAGNGRLQRFSRDGRLLDTVPVPLDVPPAGSNASIPPDAQRGRPVAVAAGAAGAVYAAEGSRNVVYVWRGSSRQAEPLGGERSTREAPAAPVGLDARGDGTLAVADGRRGEAVVYDALGHPLRTLPGPDGVRAVSWAEGRDGPRLLVTGARAVAVYADDGRLLGTRSFELGRETLVDAVESDGRLWLLTPTRLLRVEG
ncbi:MAG TPA: hypothetical protein VK610_00480 [Rhodothermales bacterium]|nr:hypothetical protein [Rhodothermales bacterium]